MTLECRICSHTIGHLSRLVGWSCRYLSGIFLTDRGAYIAKPFNFFVSPALDPMFGLDRTFLSQASALDMLCREGMDLNRLLRHGIRYLSRDEERRIRAKESDRAAGVREDISIDEGGEKFLARVKYTPKTA